jgi:hypothetical protein
MSIESDLRNKSFELYIDTSKHFTTLTTSILVVGSSLAKEFLPDMVKSQKILLFIPINFGWFNTFILASAVCFIATIILATWEYRKARDTKKDTTFKDISGWGIGFYLAGYTFLLVSMVIFAWLL